MFLNNMTRMLLDLNNISCKNVKKFQRRESLLTEAVQSRYATNESMSLHFNCVKVDDTTALVKSMTIPEMEFKVTFHETSGTCTCPDWQQMKIPC